VIYGRRRIGKTELIKNFMKNKPHIYLLCDKKGTERNAVRFKKKVSQFLNEPVIATSDWEEIFEYLADKVQDKKIVICLDEFSYLVERDDAIPSIFQVIVDELLMDKDIMLILCGSSIMMMEKGVLSQRSPLYGRKTAHIKLGEVDFSFFSQFFPLNSIEKNIEFYSVLGGVPFYLEKFQDKKTTVENINEQILSKRGRLYEEVDFLLKEELREPAVYKSILEAIASGKTRLVDIANKSGIKAQDMDRYLKVLINLGIIRREVPVTEIKSKKSIYVFDDNFFNFWFLFCEPNKSDLEIEELENITPALNSKIQPYFGKRFEELARKNILRKIDVFPFTKIGRWWGHHRVKGVRKEIEIDIVALNDQTKEILFAECKWSEKVNAKNICKELKEKSRYVPWNHDRRRESFAIFAKSFSRKIDEFEEREVHCFDLNTDFHNVLNRHNSPQVTSDVVYLSGAG